MTLFLVRWPDGSGTLVTAEGPIDLFDSLDAEGDPHAAVFREYEGHLHLSLHVVDEPANDGTGTTYPVLRMHSVNDTEPDVAIMDALAEPDGWTSFGPGVWGAWIDSIVNR